MKVLQINTVYQNGGSTGRIVYDLRNVCEANGIESYVAYGFNTGNNTDEHTLEMQSRTRRKVNILRTRLFDHHGFYNELETKKLLQWIDKIKPDIIHLHNIHNHYVHVGKLFAYIKRHNIPVVWTLHDCWAFTGHCAYFDYAKCDKWKTYCHDCPSTKEYPRTWFFDRSKKAYYDKKSAFTGVRYLTLVSPSNWLGELTRDSFLCDYPVKVINNGIDVDVFKPTESDIRKKYGIPENVHVILSVMSVWERRKGTEYLLNLPEKLTDDELLIIVGLKQDQLPLIPTKHCKGICRTTDIQELAALYSTADIFINPTLEDNFPTTNIEALACGTPVISFNTGGSPEAIDENTGYIVEQGSLEEMLLRIREIIAKGKVFYYDACVLRARTQFEKNKQYEKYIDLYKEILNK